MSQPYKTRSVEIFLLQVLSGVRYKLNTSFSEGLELIAVMEGLARGLTPGGVPSFRNDVEALFQSYGITKPMLTVQTVPAFGNGRVSIYECCVAVRNGSGPEDVLLALEQRLWALSAMVLANT